MAESKKSAGGREHHPLLRRAYEESGSDAKRALYDEWARDYDRDLEGWDYQGPERLAALFTAKLAERDAAILDIGCGTGLVGAALHAQGFTRIDGVDLSPGMLEAAAGRGVYHRLFEVDLGGEEPVLDAGPWDHATSCGTFTTNHLGPPALARVLALIRPGGLFVLTVSEPAFTDDHYEGAFIALAREGTARLVHDEVAPSVAGEGVDAHYIVLERL